MKSSGIDTDLTKTLEMVKSSPNSRHEIMGQYHQDLVRWARNVDKRYAWVVLAALWLIMACVLGPYRLYGLLFAKVTNEGIYTREEASWPVSMIFTVENICGPLVSIVVYHISGRNSMLVGGLLLALGNTLTYWSDSLLVDVITVGVVQGLGFAFIFMPFMEVINSYFIKYRNAALGFALCGGTMSIFATEPLFQWLLRRYPWRASYLGFGLISSLGVLMVPFLKPNERPTPPTDLQRPGGKGAAGPQQVKKVAPTAGANKGSTLSRMSFRALSYQNSQRRQSTILVTHQRALDRQGSIISVNPFASSAGLERKISRSIVENFQNIEVSQDQAPQLTGSTTDNKSQINNKLKRQSTNLSPAHRAALDDGYETKSLSEFGQEDPDGDFGWPTIVSILKTPGFHLIWYLELIYFWIFSIYCLVLVDFGIDRGCTPEQAASLLSFQSVGEIIGRMGLTILVDMQYLSNRNVVTLTLVIVATLLCLVTQVQGYIMIAVLTITINAFASLLYIMINGLLVDFLGERHVTIGYGMASFVVGILITFRPQAVGFFRDTLGSYNLLMIALGASSAFGAVLCILERLANRACGPPKTNNDADSTTMA